jgi:hypothetical protein
MTEKYTKEQTEELSNAYTAAKTDDERSNIVALYATKFEKDQRSIIAKLCKLKIYKKKVNISKVTKGPPQTKESMVRELEELMGLEKEELLGVEKSPKIPLNKIKEFIKNLVGE